MTNTLAYLPSISGDEGKKFYNNGTRVFEFEEKKWSKSNLKQKSFKLRKIDKIPLCISATIFSITITRTTFSVKDTQHNDNQHTTLDAEWCSTVYAGCRHAECGNADCGGVFVFVAVIFMIKIRNFCHLAVGHCDKQMF